MALTRLQMANEVLDNLGRSGSATTRSGTTLSDMSIRWLNRAQRQVSRKYDMIFIESTASILDGIKKYAFPSNLRCVFSIRLENGIESEKLTCVMPWEYDKYIPYPANTTETQPYCYIPYKASNQFELYPIPDTTYTVRMRHSVWPTDLASDSSTSDYQSYNIDMDDVTIYLATAYGFRYLQELIDSRDWNKRGWEAAKEVWMAERESFPDWAPRGTGFTLTGEGNYLVKGEYYNNPFVLEAPNG